MDNIRQHIDFRYEMLSSFFKAEENWTLWDSHGVTILRVVDEIKAQRAKAGFPDKPPAEWTVAEMVQSAAP